MTYDFTRTGPQIQAIHDTVSDPSTNQAFTDAIGEIITPKYTDVVYKSSGGNSPIENMISGIPVAATVGNVVGTSGFYSDGDGGGGSYIIIPGNSGDGIRDHNVGLNTAKLITKNGVASLKQFGLLMDGVTEQSALLNHVLSYSDLTTAEGNGLVYTTSVVNIPSNKILRGKWGITSGGGNCNHNGFDLDQVENVVLEDTIIKGVENEDGFDAAIRIISSKNVTLRRVIIDNIGQYLDAPNERGQGIFIRPVAFDAGTDMNEDINIENCRITNIKGNGAQRGDFIEIRRTNGINVANNYFQGSNRMGIAITNQVSGASITNNKIYDAGLACVDVESNEQNFDAKDIVISGNHFRNWGNQQSPFKVGVQQYGVDLHPTSNRVIITGNNFDSSNNPESRGFIYAINSSREYIISNNTFSGATTIDCLRLREGGGTNRIIIDGNTFRFTTQNIIELFACSDVYISNCIVDAQSPKRFVNMQDGGALTVRDCAVNYAEQGIFVGGFGSASVNPNVHIDNIRMTRITQRAVTIQMDSSSSITKLNLTNIDATADGTPSESEAFSVIGNTSFENANLLDNQASGWSRVWSASAFDSNNYRVIFDDTTTGYFVGQTAFILTDNKLCQWNGTSWYKP